MQEGLQTIDVHLDNPQEALTLFGTEDKNLRQMEEQLNVTIVSRGEKVNVSGLPEHVSIVEGVIASLLALIRRGLSITERDVVYAVELAKKGKINQFEALYEDEITRNAKGKPIRVKTLGQRDYINAIKRNDLTFGIGPAGTGKTYLAVVMAVNALKNGDVKRIVLTRPAVEAGESLGFLPGDLKEKVDPYLRPLYDSLHDVFGTEHTARLIERGTIEIAPLAYMRGRTLDDAFALLDEAQNTTPEQMKMFLTRLGFGSKMIITGDITQVDLPKGVTSGLKVAEQKLSNVKGSSFIHLDETDVVRHPLVQRIIDAYEQNE
ncbi:PhoH family protein [Salimicrobium halophilum]|uniref:PhoH-like protein n=1 Tax=Salimicrobium halophilum TaxID=86666 RepID=A0A1G8PQ28_9BACI|nr:PhoH family protein [Salimicrobium halophilum]SDI94649.1 phosphate starvation-inducible protein PhoH [Salimicrobium halophilum]